LRAPCFSQAYDTGLGLFKNPVHLNNKSVEDSRLTGWGQCEIILSELRPGKRLLQNLINLARNPQLGGRIAFVEDYGEQLAQYLVHGVDKLYRTT
jgi:hypothetical protein